MELMAKNQTGKGLGVSLPFFSEGLESDFLGEKQAPQIARAAEQRVVLDFRCIVFLRG